MAYVRGRYSKFFRPFLMAFDVFVLNYLAYKWFDFNQQPLYFFDYTSLNDKHLLYLVYSSLFWGLSSAVIQFYRVYRYTSLLDILSLIMKQFLVYTLIFYAFLGIFRSIDIQAFDTLSYLLVSFSLIGSVKIISYLALKYFRRYLHGNVRNVLIIGNNQSAQQLRTLFLNRKELGYDLAGYFSDAPDKIVDGNISKGLMFLKDNPSIDEVYCSVDEISKDQLNAFVKQAELNHANIKFIPTPQTELDKQMKAEFYDYIPILSMPDIALNKPINQLTKRTFDLLFSLFVLVFILSWLTPLLYILIKLDSKGPLFYKHKRNGINYKEFSCYKFRSLKQGTKKESTYVAKNDQRLTRIGRFLRTTSLDELPQFFNVLKGDMSVVGPRPHMQRYTDDYAKTIDTFSFYHRHNVRPGITGLAQVKGLRGAVKTDSDIINRIKMDNFYLQNWSLFLDIKIIFLTIIKIIKGDEKAY